MSRSRQFLLVILGLGLLVVATAWLSRSPDGRGDLRTAADGQEPGELPKRTPRLHGSAGNRMSDAGTRDGSPTGTGDSGDLIIRTVQSPGGEAVEDCSAAVQRGGASWERLAMGGAEEGEALRTPRAGISRIALLAPDAGYWISDALDPEAIADLLWDVRLLAPLEITGYVTAQDGQAAAIDASVDLANTPALHDALGADYEVEYGKDSRFRIRDLVPGAYVLEATPGSHFEGATCHKEVISPARGVELVLEAQPTLEVRIVDGKGVLLPVGGQLEGVVGLEGFDAADGSARPWHVPRNPLVLSISKDDPISAFRAYGDGYEPSEPYHPTWPPRTLHDRVALVLRPAADATALVTLDLVFRDAPPPKQVYLRRTLGTHRVMVNGALRAVGDGRIQLRLPVGAPVSMSVEPMTRRGSHATHAPFHPEDNPWAPQSFVVRPTSGRHVELVFERLGGIHLSFHSPAGRSVWATLQGANQELRVYFCPKDMGRGHSHPATPPIPPGLWRVRFDDADLAGTPEVAVRSGEITRIPEAKCRKAPKDQR